MTDNDKNGMNLLMFSVDCNFSITTVEFLIKAGCEVNSQDVRGDTALHYACYMENTDLVKSLLKHGADPHIKNKENSSALDSAEEYEELLELLKS